VHWSFGLIFLWILYYGYANGFDSSGIFWLVLAMLTLFVCVVLHEFGHSLTARRFGVDTRDIILLPIGGVARLERLPKEPWHEFWVAIAGPLVNFVIAFVLSPYFFIESLDSVFQTIAYNDQSISATTFVPYIIFMNVFLALFNLIPAFPMDGGRVLRALLSIRWDRAKATQLASIIGQIFAVLFIILSVYPFESPMFTLLGIFIFFVARQENRAIQREAKLSSIPITDFYRTDFTKLEPHDTIKTAQTVSEIKKEKHFLVFNEKEQIIGVLHNMFLEEAIKVNDLEAPVAVYMSQHFAVVNASSNLYQIFSLMQREGFSILPVLEDGKITGVVDKEMMEAYFRKK